MPYVMHIAEFYLSGCLQLLESWKSTAIWNTCWKSWKCPGNFYV